MPLIFDASYLQKKTKNTSWSAGSLIITLALFLLFSNSAISEPFSEQDMMDMNGMDLRLIQKNMPVPNTPITLQMAVARALKFNLDHRVATMKQSLASSLLESGQYDMLPKLIAKAGYSWRDTNMTRNSLNPDTGTVSDIGFISSDKSFPTYDIGLSWNLLDFGTSYFNSKQNTDRLLIASEQRRKTIHSVIQKVRTAFWSALAAEKLSKHVASSIIEAEQALDDSRKIVRSRSRSPLKSLRYQRSLLENLQLLESVERALARAHIELTGLMGLLPGSQFELVEPAWDQSQYVNLSVEKMEEQALLNNTDLREQSYNVRIAATETRTALLKQFPGLSFNYGYKYEGNSFLKRQNWHEAGVAVSFNLFNLVSAPAKIRAARAGEDVAKTQRMALQMAVLTQIHLARHQYIDATRQFKRTDNIYQVDSEIARLSMSMQQTKMGGKLDRIAADVSSILSSVRRYQAMARVQEAMSRLQATMGVTPDISNLDSMDLPALANEIEYSLNSWGSLSNSFPATEEKLAQ